MSPGLCHRTHAAAQPVFLVPTFCLGRHPSCVIKFSVSEQWSAHIVSIDRSALTQINQCGNSADAALRSPRWAPWGSPAWGPCTTGPRACAGCTLERCNAALRSHGLDAHHRPLHVQASGRHE
jgi:hypothetical protein